MRQKSYKAEKFDMKSFPFIYNLLNIRLLIFYLEKNTYTISPLCSLCIQTSYVSNVMQRRTFCPLLMEKYIFLNCGTSNSYVIKCEKDGRVKYNLNS